MAKRLFNLSKWSFVSEGEALHYSNPKPRLVVLEVNCPDKARFYVEQDVDDVDNSRAVLADREAGRRPSPGAMADGEQRVQFIGVVEGLDRLEFTVDGAFNLIVEGGGAYVYTADGQDISSVVVEPKIFTRLANRRQRNPHLEMLEYTAKTNLRRLEEKMREEAEFRIRAIEKRMASFVPQRDIRAPAGKVGREELDTGASAGADSPVADAPITEEPPPSEGSKRKSKKDQVEV